MDDKYIKIEVDVNGEAKIDAIGFKGTGCKTATKNFENIYSQLDGSNKPEINESIGAAEVQLVGG